MTFVALLSSEGVAADAATGVAVALLVDGADHVAATFLNTHTHAKKKKKSQHFLSRCLNHEFLVENQVLLEENFLSDRSG